MDMQKERRRFARLNVLVDVVYKKHAGLDGNKLSLAKNISKGGICLIVYEELKESDTLELIMRLPEDNGTVSALGRVVWVKEFIIGDNKRFDAGIEFIGIEEEDINKINKYVF
jgi:c-di-GMP-binding flagellar brake protein YcgR